MTKTQTRDFDLEDRTARFGEIVIGFSKAVPVNLVTTLLIPATGSGGEERWSELCRSR